MNGRIIRDIRAGRRLPKALELEAGLPFYWDSIRADMCIWVERMLRRKAEEPDPSWNRPGYLMALRSLRDGARDPRTADEHLVGLVLQVVDALPPWALTEKRRCRVYLSRLGAHPLPTDEESRWTPGGSADLDADTGTDRQAAPVEADSLVRHPASIPPQANDPPERMRDILVGRAWPEAVELLRGMPFFKGSLHEDMRHYAGRLLGGIERDGYKPDDWNDCEASIIHHARHLRQVASIRTSTQWDLRPIVDRLMLAFPTAYHEGWLRCSYYRAALGVREAKVDIASTAVSLALVPAEAESPPKADYQLIATALGWLAEVAAGDPALAGQPRPIRFDAPEDTARHYGQMLVEFMRMPPTRSGP
ncbi:hypothetical protein [Microvirga aerophila]|uniref:Uncharacterized protein n=1 Tax=Microvirga aerophila TaxID=670291 RepID=A0A512BNW8_9HYPH|nr:hypothetical protein [Microvirga aerophila]GEO13652.1 hypothetical protein MAE02_13480 [Microvirga aerophila]